MTKFPCPNCGKEAILLGTEGLKCPSCGYYEYSDGVLGFGKEAFPHGK